MGLHFSTNIICNQCSNYCNFDTGFKIPAPLQYIDNHMPRIICGRCGAQDISISDSSFCSADMSYDKSDSAYIPENMDLTWTLPDASENP